MSSAGQILAAADVIEKHGHVRPSVGDKRVRVGLAHAFETVFLNKQGLFELILLLRSNRLCSFEVAVGSDRHYYQQRYYLNLHQQHHYNAAS